MHPTPSSTGTETPCNSKAPCQISVVIPTFNRSGLVADAVASVLAQRLPPPFSEPPVEVIVVDDGSTDDTAAVLARFGDAIRYVGQENRGVSAARNTGIRLARGQWITFLDSDDLWLPGKLAAQMEYLASRSELRIAQTDELWVRNGHRLNPGKVHRKPRGYCFPFLLELCLVSPSAVAVHRELFDEVGLFDESLPACEDYELWLRIGCRYPIGLLQKPLVIKRGGHPDQLSATVAALDRFRIQALAGLMRRPLFTPTQWQWALEVLRRKCTIYGKGCRKRGRLDEARAILSLPDELLNGAASR